MASAVTLEENSVILVGGPPGSGKSALCAGLAQRGGTVLADGRCRLDPTLCRMMSSPEEGQVHLHSDVLQWLGLESSSLPSARAGVYRRILPSQSRRETELPIKALLILQPSTASSGEIVELKGLKKLAALGQIVDPVSAISLGRAEQHLVRLAEQMSVFKLSFASGKRAFDSHVDFVRGLVLG